MKISSSPERDAFIVFLCRMMVGLRHRRSRVWRKPASSGIWGPPTGDNSFWTKAANLGFAAAVALFFSLFPQAHATDVFQTRLAGGSESWNGPAIWGGATASAGNDYFSAATSGSILTADKLNYGRIKGRVRALNGDPPFAGNSLTVVDQTELLLKGEGTVATVNLILNGGLVRFSPNAGSNATLSGALIVASESYLGIEYTGANTRLVIASSLTGGNILNLRAGSSGANPTVVFSGDLTSYTGTLRLGGGEKPLTLDFDQDYDLPNTKVVMGVKGTSDKFTLDQRLKFQSFTFGAYSLKTGVLYSAADLNALLGDGTQFTGSGSLAVYHSPLPPPPDNKARVHLIGDSTVAQYASSDPKRGWGQMISGFFRENVLIDNRAVPGASTKTFISNGWWSQVMASLRANDYVLIQFGHNDSHDPSLPESTDVASDFKTYLQRYVDDTRSKGGVPILVTPMYRRSFDANGRLLSYLVDASGQPYNDLKPYATAMKQVAAANNVTCIDLFTLSGDFMQQIGDAACVNLLAVSDVTHWNEKGAGIMAAFVARGLAQTGEDLKGFLLPGVVPAPFSPGSSQPVDSPPVSSTPGGPGDFALVQAGSGSTIVYSDSDAKVVEIAAGLFADDVQRVSGVRPTVGTDLPATGPVVLIGTIGKNAHLDSLIAAGKIDISAIRGGWERYRIEVVENPFPGVGRALVIAGSDRRGTAYGVFSLSEGMGVSPWYWWADSAVRMMPEIYVGKSAFTSKEPSVLYRGIFINDEDWGLQEWAEKTFDLESRDIGPKTYAKIFELLLRLKANCVWPAMHPSTKAFNSFPGNKIVADDYAIVMGSSHAEPMLRNNVYEWSRFTDPVANTTYTSTQFNYQTNPGGVYRYWEQAAVNNGSYENLYTLGKRGIHDSGMVEGSTNAEKAAWLNTIFTDQRKILAQHVNGDVPKIAQVFVPYKEVLDIYDTGLVNIPDDVTLVWPDDNHGFIRRLSSTTEQLRRGGGGVYYHLSYWGSPADYLWLCSTPPALVWEELTKAYSYNCSRVWIINVGDIKPGEIGLEFAMRLAWDVNRYDRNAQNQWLTEWATREFGAEHAPGIVSLLNTYYQLGYARKPEHMSVKDGDALSPAEPYPLFSQVHYGDESSVRLAKYAGMLAQANAIHDALPLEKRSAFFETVLYPVRGAEAMNRKFLHATRAYAALVQGRNTVEIRNSASQQGYTNIQTDTAIYNQTIEGGKWSAMMDSKPRGLAVFNQPSLPSTPTLDAGILGVAIEGRLEPAYISAAGVTYQSLPGYVMINATSEGVVTEPMTVAAVGGKPALHIPPGAGTSSATSGGYATYAFNIATGGTYTLSCEIYCPTADDDSWYIQIDDATPVVWNNLNNGGVWSWATFGAVNLAAGQHTLRIRQREDGTSMANIKLVSSGLVLFERRAREAFELPEFNAFTQRSYFVDLFNTGTGSVSWRIATAHPWVVVGKTSGTTTSEERVRVSIDWAGVPRSGTLSSSLTITSAGKSLVVPVKVWSPVETLPPSVDMVEDNRVIAMEAEHYSSRIAGSDATWEKLPGLGAGEGSVFVFPPTALSRAGVSDIVSASPMLAYNVFVRQPGAVSVTVAAIPTLAINQSLGLRYAVAFDDEVPQIVDMSRPSGSDNRWSRSVLRGRIEYSSTHTLNTAGAHTLKIWMVDPGVVLDRFVVSSGSLPNTYEGMPESAAVSHGKLSIDGGEFFEVPAGASVTYDELTNKGTLDVATGSLVVSGDVINRGTLRLYAGAELQMGGQLINHGVLDLLTWNGVIPGGLVNNGTVLTRSDVRVSNVAGNGNDLNITFTAYSGHHYQLQTCDDDLSGAWRDLGASVAGDGMIKTFTIFNALASPAGRGFYRVKVFP